MSVEVRAALDVDLDALIQLNRVVQKVSTLRCIPAISHRWVEHLR